MRIRRQFERRTFRHPECPKDLPSMTLPDQSLTVLQILQRYASGVAANSFPTVFDVPDDVSDTDAFGFSIDNDNPDLLTSQQELSDEIQEVQRRSVRVKPVEDAKKSVEADEKSVQSS